MILFIVNMMASTSMSDSIMQMLSIIADVDRFLMADMAIRAVMANLVKVFH